MINVKENQLLLKHWSLFTNPLNMLSMMFLFPFKCNNLHSQKESVQLFHQKFSHSSVLFWMMMKLSEQIVT